jgi:hypothetical protein
MHVSRPVAEIHNGKEESLNMGPGNSAGTSPDAGKQPTPAGKQAPAPEAALDPRSSLDGAPPLPPRPSSAGTSTSSEGPSGEKAAASLPGNPAKSAGGSPSDDRSGEERAPSERAKFFNNVPPKFDLNKWIEMSGLKNGTTDAEKAIFKEDLNKIRRLGTWKEPEGPGDSKAPLLTRMLRAVPMKLCRAVMAASWVATVGGLAAFAVLSPPGLLVLGVPILAANWLVQKTCGWLHNQKFNSVFSELRRETTRAGSLQAGIAWAGVMHDFLEKQNPLLFRRNQTKLSDFSDSTSLEAVKRQLRQAAQLAASKLDSRENDNKDRKGRGEPLLETYLKDQFFNDMLSQNDQSLDDFAKRCMGFPKASASYTNPLTLLKKFWYGK